MLVLLVGEGEEMSDPITDAMNDLIRAEENMAKWNAGRQRQKRAEIRQLYQLIGFVESNMGMVGVTMNLPHEPCPVADAEIPELLLDARKSLRYSRSLINQWLQNEPK